MGRRGRRSKQLLGKENGGHWKLTEDALRVELALEEDMGK